MSKRPGFGTPSPKKTKANPGCSKTPSASLTPKKSTPSPRKFRPKKYYSPKKSPRKLTLESTGELADTEVVIPPPGRTERTSSEVYYTANFKEVLTECLIPSNPEGHVISDHERSMVKDFMDLES
jgi:hypothetical protein